MLALVVLIAAVVFVVYVLYVVFWSTSGAQETGHSIAHFFVDSPDDEDSVPQHFSRDKYCTNYNEPGKQLLILFGTEYGFSEEVAKKLFDRLSEDAYQKLSLQPRVLNASNFEKLDLIQEQLMLCVFSTTGDGVPPTDAYSFIEFLNSSSHAPSLDHLHFSVLALGDSNYPHYCKCGRNLDSKLQELGGRRLYRRVDIDQEDWPSIEGWMEGLLERVVELDLRTELDYLDLSSTGDETGHGRTRPFMAPMTVKYPLTVMNTPLDKETLHAEFDLTGSELTYTSGDALGIYPLNNPPEVDALLSALHCGEDCEVLVPSVCYSPRPEGEHMSLREALLRYYDLKTVRPDLVKAVVGEASDPGEREKGDRLLVDGLSRHNLALAQYLSEREVVDVLRDFPSSSLPLPRLLSLLRTLQPRYYSIASSPQKDPSKVAVCAAVLRYTVMGRPCTGVCTTYLQDRMTAGDSCPVFISQNPDFRLPASGSTPVIMIGPGTGIAPFRAFIQERVLMKASGANVFYFGCRHKDKDFLYKDELEQWVSEGLLELRAAFSRDQPNKLYVQNLISEDGKQIWQLIESGAHIYVCGDAKSMAGDVHSVLLQVFMQHGELSEAEAENYMQTLEENARYQRDVWVT